MMQIPNSGYLQGVLPPVSKSRLRNFLYPLMHCSAHHGAIHPVCAFVVRRLCHGTNCEHLQKVCLFTIRDMRRDLFQDVG